MVRFSRSTLSLFLTLTLVALTTCAFAEDSATAKKKSVAKKTTAVKKKSVAKKTSTKTSAAKAVRKSTAGSSGSAYKSRLTRASVTRGPKVNWKDVVDRASKGNSSEGDDLNGEDLVVREAALSALGQLNGSVVVSDPKSGRILSIVNQQLAFSGGEQPCSTIKLPVALAALSEGIINRDTQVALNRRFSMNLTEAIAHSNNPFFENLGNRMGFEKVSQYATTFGFGEKAGYHIAEEQLGTFPQVAPSYGGIKRMSSFGQDVQVTPLQLSAFVSAIANGGTLYYLQRPKTPEEVENFQPQVKRQLDIQPILPDLREGMMAAVDHGTARRAQNTFDTVYGKTGTCSHNGNHLGWFASFQGNADPRLSVVVLLRGGHYAGGAHAAEVAGKVYRNLNAARNRTELVQPTVSAAEQAPDGH